MSDAASGPGRQLNHSIERMRITFEIECGDLLPYRTTAVCFRLSSKHGLARDAVDQGIQGRAGGVTWGCWSAQV